ncbi:hypothetical protein [Flavobacterium sp.]|uniref:hypothetical protein n=1 Tax=Flavobacterium sp. TaxID=239 RepID=UPI00286CD435|nr:hypothetical protein [Flavobacterium sp.]
MSVVKRKSQKMARKENLDDGISVKDALSLIKKSEYFDEIYKIFKIGEFENDFINIKGAEHIVEQLIKSDEECLKLDIDSELSNVNIEKFTEENQIIFEFANIDNIEILKQTKSDLIYAESTYSVKSEYLNDMYQIEKYLDYCLKNKFQDIVDKNLEMLKEKNEQNKKSKKFRLLKREDDKYFVRGITSVDSYRDYNLRISLFIALIELHKLIKFKSHSYFVSSYSFTESDLKVTFKSSTIKKVTNDIEIGFALELVNDEIRRDAVKFNGIFTILMGNAEVYVKPEETKSNILSFTHSVNIDTIKEKLSTLNESINIFIDETVDDAKSIKILEKPDLFREHLVQKIHNSRNVEFNKLYKTQVKTLLSNKVKTIFELAEIFNNINIVIADEHVSSLDFWRYKLYQVLMDEVKYKH